LEERGAPRRREFVIEASANGHSCTGVGPNKKVAKRNAAEALLNQLGYGNPPSNPKPVLKTEKETEIGDKTRKVTFVEEKTETTPSVGGSGGRQLVPGILLVGDQSTNFQQVSSRIAFHT
jgi:double-stranded RNA-binding protein Staufen